MSKMINPKELSEIIDRLLVGDMTETHLDEQHRYSSFLEDIAGVVANHCGGEVVGVSFDEDHEDPGSEWLVAVRGNADMPEEGGVWSEYDPEGEL